MQQLLGTISARPRDRRVSTRYQPAFGTVCRLGARNARQATGFVWDLSTTGVSLLMADPPEEGTVIAAELAAEGGYGPLPVKVQVVHVRAVSTGDYFVGARFIRALSAAEMVPFVTPVLSSPLPTEKAG